VLFITQRRKRYQWSS